LANNIGQKFRFTPVWHSGSHCTRARFAGLVRIVRIMQWRVCTY